MWWRCDGKFGNFVKTEHSRRRFDSKKTCNDNELDQSRIHSSGPGARTVYWSVRYRLAGGALTCNCDWLYDTICAALNGWVADSGEELREWQGEFRSAPRPFRWWWWINCCSFTRRLAVQTRLTRSLAPHACSFLFDGVHPTPWIPRSPRNLSVSTRVKNSCKPPSVVISTRPFRIIG